MAEEKRASREELSRLRIDRDAVALREAPAWRGYLLTGGIAVAFLLVAFIGWKLTLGRSTQVRVAFAERTAAGAATAGAVLTGSGYVVTGERYVSLGVRVPSRIERYLVEEGQRVEQGQVLVQLDPRQYDAALAQAKANLVRARADLELSRKELARSKELVRRGVQSEADLDVKQNQLNVAEATVAQLVAAVDRAKVDLDDTVIRAPTSGIILEKFKEVGEIAVPGGFAGSGELIRMANLEDLRAELDVNESDLARVKMGQPAEVQPDAYADRRYKARVVKLYPQINRQKGTLKVEVGIEDADEWLRPDMSVRVTFLQELEPAADGAEPAQVLAPREAIRKEGGASYAWVVTEGRLRKQPVETAGERGANAVVAKGLSGGEALVLGPGEGLSEGQRVEVMKAGS
ncbi:MAG TPA: efflux RND transporter periplasmic adaptor subunit [Myxococcota bacterium]|nr:efflux RND transporter periplasmic adaptor subunit [Myxococcota bacterium]